jgi:hypothetical protein
MNKNIGLSIVALFITLSAFGVEMGNSYNRVSFKFEFLPGSEVLESRYSGNEYVLYKLYQFIKYNISEISSNSAHLSIISHIKNEDRDDLHSVNRASIIASVVRAHLKLKFGLTNDNFTFYIDCEGVQFDKVIVEYKPRSLKPSENQEIYYTQNSSYKNLVETILKYKGIPYLSNYQESSELIAPVKPADNFSNARIETKDIGAVSDTSYTTQNKCCDSNYVQEENRETGRNIVIVFSGNTSSEVEKRTIPILGVGTNLLKFFGVTPANIKHTLPNLSLEYYFAKQYSAKIEGVLSPLINNTNVNNDDSWWRASSLSLEGRYWPLKVGVQHSGLYTGLFGLYGNYDIKPSGVESFGNTGDFYGAGISVGYSLKICDWLSIEAGVRGVYRIDKWSTYEVRDNGFFLNESGTNNGLKIHDYNIGLVIRYGLKK